MYIIQDIRNYLQTLFDKSTLQIKAKANLTTNDLYKKQVDVASFTYGGGDLAMQSLVATNSQNEQVFADMHPIMKGQKTELQILNVLEWDSGLEATIICSYYDFCFAFFATDYYVNKSLYKEGSFLFIDLSAMDITTEKADDIIDLQIKAALENNKPNTEDIDDTYSFNFKNLVGYKCYNLHCPDEGFLKSNLNNVKYLHLKEIELVKSDVCINRGSEDEKD